jgi:hypothetical protein
MTNLVHLVNISCLELLDVGVLLWIDSQNHIIGNISRVKLSGGKSTLFLSYNLWSDQDWEMESNEMNIWHGHGNTAEGIIKFYNVRGG